MIRRYRYDKDLECMVEIGGNYFEETPKGPSLISDDLGTQGVRHMANGKKYDSKSRFRAETKRRGLVEVGTGHDFADRRPATPKGHYHQVAKDAWQQFDGNFNGIADRVKAENARTEWRRRNG